MKIVLDASAAIAAVLQHPSGPAVLDLVEEATMIVAPDLFIAEVTSGLWKYVVAQQLSIDDAGERLGAAVKLVDRYLPVDTLAQEVLREAAARQHSVYDIFYAVLARREGAAVATIDQRLRKLLTSMNVPVHPGS
jgi:predicted nucleic acid-binding protein